MRAWAGLFALAVSPAFAADDGIRLRTVLDLEKPLLLRVENERSVPLLVKSVHVVVCACAAPENVVCDLDAARFDSVPPKARRDFALVSLDRFAACLNAAGYSVPAGARPVEIAETPQCPDCAPDGGTVKALPFTVRVSLRYQGTPEDARTFTNYLFFQVPGGERPVTFRP
jgi:hypothetical protein